MSDMRNDLQNDDLNQDTGTGTNQNRTGTGQDLNRGGGAATTQRQDRTTRGEIDESDELETDDLSGDT